MIKICLTIASIIFSNIVFSQSACNIQIKQYGLLLIGDTKWQISDKKIYFERENYDGTNDILCKPIAEKEMQIVCELASKVDIQNNKKDTVPNAPDDIGEYDFEISTNNHSEQFHLFQVKVMEVFNLVKYINSLLSTDYQIGYNDNYFRYLNYKN